MDQNQGTLPDASDPMDPKDQNQGPCPDPDLDTSFYVEVIGSGEKSLNENNNKSYVSIVFDVTDDEDTNYSPEGSATVATSGVPEATYTDAIVGTSSVSESTYTDAIVATSSVPESTYTDAILASSSVTEPTSTDAVLVTSSVPEPTYTDAILATSSVPGATYTDAILATSSVSEANNTNAFVVASIVPEANFSYATSLAGSVPPVYTVGADHPWGILKGPNNQNDGFIVDSPQPSVVSGDAGQCRTNRNKPQDSQMLEKGETITNIEPNGYPPAKKPKCTNVPVQQQVINLGLDAHTLHTWSGPSRDTTPLPVQVSSISTRYESLPPQGSTAVIPAQEEVQLFPVYNRSSEARLVTLKVSQFDSIPLSLTCVAKQMCGDLCYQCPYCGHEDDIADGSMGLHLVRHLSLMCEDPDWNTRRKPGMKVMLYSCCHCDFVTHHTMSLVRHFQHVHSYLGPHIQVRTYTELLQGRTDRVTEQNERGVYNVTTRSNILKCGMCDYQTLMPDLLVYHMTQSHQSCGELEQDFNLGWLSSSIISGKETSRILNKLTFICTTCYTDFGTLAGIEKHIWTEHYVDGRFLFKCDHCMKVSQGAPSMENHIKNAHPNTGQLSCIVALNCDYLLKLGDITQDAIYTLLNPPASQLHASIGQSLELDRKEDGLLSGSHTTALPITMVTKDIKNSRYQPKPSAAQRYELEVKAATASLENNSAFSAEIMPSSVHSFETGACRGLDPDTGLMSDPVDQQTELLGIKKRGRGRPKGSKKKKSSWRNKKMSAKHDKSCLELPNDPDSVIFDMLESDSELNLTPPEAETADLALPMDPDMGALPYFTDSNCDLPEQARDSNTRNMPNSRRNKTALPSVNQSTAAKLVSLEVPGREYESVTGVAKKLKDMPVFQCPYCGCVRSSRQAAASHIAEHLPSQTGDLGPDVDIDGSDIALLYCSQCDFVTHHPMSVVKHFQVCHDYQSPVMARIEPRDVVSGHKRRSLSVNGKKYYQIEREGEVHYSCKHCKYRVTSAQTLLWHMDGLHGGHGEVREALDRGWAVCDLAVMVSEEDVCPGQLMAPHVPLEDVFVCTTCYYLVTTLAAVQSHCWEKHYSDGRFVFSCPHCPFSHQVAPTIVSHVKKAHRDTGTPHCHVSLNPGLLQDLGQVNLEAI